MKRRGFLQRLASAFAAVPVLSALSAHTAPMQEPMVEPLKARATDNAGEQYRYVRAHQPLIVGQVVKYDSGKFMGYSVSNVRKDEYGWVQVYDVSAF